MSSLILSFLLGLVVATLFYSRFPVAMLRNILLIAANRREFFDCQELVLNIQINESWANLGLWESETVQSSGKGAWRMSFASWRGLIPLIALSISVLAMETSSSFGDKSFAKSVDACNISLIQTAYAREHNEDDRIKIMNGSLISSKKVTLMS